LYCYNTIECEMFQGISAKKYVTIHSRFDGTTNKAEL